mgnify:CR=1 FL=1
MGRVAVVTGGARGIGRATAEILAARGHDVCIADLLGDSAARAATEITESTGRKAIGVQCDVSNAGEVSEAFSRARRELGPVLVLVNCAAITTNVATVRNMSLASWERELAVNLTGTFLCIKEALEDMVAAKWGRIVNVSSGAAELGGYGQCSYVASKAGVIALTKTVCLEHARDNITCNVVLPGLIDTAAAASIREDIRERIIRRIPVRRMGRPEEVAAVIAFLCSEEASYVNGAAIWVSAGQELFTF